MLGDARTVLRQLLDAIGGKVDEEDATKPWRKRLEAGADAKRKAPGGNKLPDGDPIHPLHLCEEVRDFMKRDAILCVDGQEIPNYGRQWIPTFLPGHRLNSGPFGTMGVGLPFGVGAKLARPDKQVIVLHGDGSFGLNAMELDTAVRHKIPLLVVISLNGGWTGDPKREKAGRDSAIRPSTSWRGARLPTANTSTPSRASRRRWGAARPRSTRAASPSSTSRPFWARRATQTKFTAYMT